MPPNTPHPLRTLARTAGALDELASEARATTDRLLEISNGDDAAAAMANVTQLIASVARCTALVAECSLAAITALAAIEAAKEENDGT